VRARDLVRFDVGCAVNGYRATVARTAVVGEPTARQAEVHEAVLAGIEAALGGLRPGTRAATVFEGAVAAVRAAGIAGYRQDLVGHGVGLDHREPPWLAAGGEAVLEMGMVVLLDTPYFEYGWGGVSVKETVLVTNVGARPLNRSARGLVVLD
jgi:Xaa-Pro aminopeptidase